MPMYSLVGCSVLTLATCAFFYKVVAVTKTMLKPLADYAEEERMKEIEERVGYSE